MCRAVALSVPLHAEVRNEECLTNENIQFYRVLSEQENIFVLYRKVLWRCQSATTYHTCPMVQESSARPTAARAHTTHL